MDNKEIYKKTIGFSIWRLVWNIISFLLLAAALVLGYLIAENAFNKGLIGLTIGGIIGIVAIIIISRYTAYSYKAGQIAMMTKGITEGKLPDDPVAEGKKIVKQRFATVAVYFAATNAIKGVFSQIGQGITAAGKAIGGDNGGAIGSTVSGAIQTVVDYLCDCCLGWVFYRKDEKATKATCEGAVLFFKHGKTLAKNLGRVFGMGFVSLLVIGGIFTGIFYLIFLNFPDFFITLSHEVVESAARNGSDVPAFVADISTLTLVCSGISGILIWSFIHSSFVRPFVLVGVLRNYIESGQKDIPSEESFAELDKKSSKFAKLHSEL